METKWNYIQKAGLLFLFVYIFIYASSSQLLLTFILDPLWQKVIPWFAGIVGRDTPITIFPNGSGDTTFNYYQILFFALVALVLAIGISLIDSKRKNYSTLLGWLTVLVRYYLALLMITYGFAKLYYMQFTFPSVSRLDQELGDFSPMGLLWTFMGYSKGYTMFSGALEFIGGIFLLSRYTTTLGALTTFGVMLNVMMLNYCYDVPVKILSTHMVLMSLFLIALDGKRLFNFFFSNQKVEPYIFPEVVPAKFVTAKNVIKYLAIIGFLCYSIYEMNGYKKKWGPDAPKPFFYGKYVVESFERKPSNQTDSLTTKPMEWASFIQSWEGMASIKTTDNRTLRYNFEPDITNHLFRLRMKGESDFQELTYELLDSNRVHINGTYRTDTLDILMKKEDTSDRLLVKRGFHWVNEYPFNR